VSEDVGTAQRQLVQLPGVYDIVNLAVAALRLGKIPREGVHSAPIPRSSIRSPARR
jgi:hypothetical protein